MNIVNFAHQILDLEEDRNHWRRQALHYKGMYDMHAKSTDESIQHNMQLMGTVLLAALDEDSGLNRMYRALDRDPLKGARQE
jgi:hypothetical protein